MKSTSLLAILCSAAPAVARVREYNLTLSQIWTNIDGKGRAASAINGVTPGPVLEADEGDILRVNVVNKLLTEAALHWHGIYQKGSMWQDGTPGVTQWPLEPRTTHTYEMTLDNQTGSYWYHGHFGAVLIDGQRGAMWIRPSPDRPRPYSLISQDQNDIDAMMTAESHPHHIMLADWFDDDLEMQSIQYRDTGIEPSCARSIIFNDKGRIDCLSRKELDKYDPEQIRDTNGCLPLGRGTAHGRVNDPVPCEQSHSDFAVFQAEDGDRFMFLNFLHGGSHHEMRVSIDEHDMWIVAADGDFVHPKKVQAVDVSMGERISVVVKLDKEPKEYAIRASSLSTDQIIQGISILRYPGIVPSSRKKNDVMLRPDTKPHIDVAGNLLSGTEITDEFADLPPFPARSPAQSADHTFRFAVNQTEASTWVIASEAHHGFRQQMPPIMWNDESMGPTSFKGIKNGSTVDIIFENYASGMHPFHKHNHKMFILGKGTGFFKWKDVAEAVEKSPESINLVNPVLRDEIQLGSNYGDWVVVRYTITFPALSMLHCHKIAHFMGGQQIILAEGVEDMEPPPEYIKQMTHADFVPPFRYGPLD